MHGAVRQLSKVLASQGPPTPQQKKGRPHESTTLMPMGHEQSTMFIGRAGSCQRKSNHPAKIGPQQRFCTLPGPEPSGDFPALALQFREMPIPSAADSGQTFIRVFQGNNTESPD